MKKLLSAFLLLFFASLAQAQNHKILIRMATSWPTNFMIFEDSVKDFKNMIENASGGRISVRIDSANKHKSPFGVFDLVQSGQYEMGHSASYYWKGKDMNTVFFTTMPFGMTALEQYAWFYHGGGMELADEVYSKYGMYSFPAGNTGAQMSGWFRKEIKSLDDLKGLKLRAVGFGGEILSKLGVSIVNIAPGELFTALERGVIDAAEWVGPALDLKIGLHKVAKYYYSGWAEPAVELQFLVNKKFMDSLPEDLRNIVKDTMRLSAFNMLIRSTYENAKAVEFIDKEYPDIQFVNFPQEVMSAIKKVNSELLQEQYKDNELGQKIIKHQSEFLKMVRAWTLNSEYSYLKSLEQE